jgi:hypothetical protein
MKPQFDLVLVACASQKLNHASPAGDLYVSQLFSASKRWAIQNGAAWAIVSALHGLLRPSVIVEPYDQRLKGTRADCERFAALIASQVAAFADPCGPPLRVAVLAGRDYVRPLRTIPAFGDFAEPMRGLGIGQRLQWLKLNAG